MTQIEIQNKVKRILSNLFNVPIESIGKDSSPDTVQGWESLQHLNLVIALEEEFKISLNDQEVVDMLSYDLIVNILAEKLAKS